MCKFGILCLGLDNSVLMSFLRLVSSCLAPCKGGYNVWDLILSVHVLCDLHWLGWRCLSAPVLCLAIALPLLILTFASWGLSCTADVSLLVGVVALHKHFGCRFGIHAEHISLRRKNFLYLRWEIDFVG